MWYENIKQWSAPAMTNIPMRPSDIRNDRNELFSSVAQRIFFEISARQSIGIATYSPPEFFLNYYSSVVSTIG